jgi:hypothetical protein
MEHYTEVMVEILIRQASLLGGVNERAFADILASGKGWPARASSRR